MHVIELEGAAFHDDPEARARDDARQARLEDEFGFSVSRYTYKDIVLAPHHFIAETELILRQRTGRRRRAA